MSAGNRMRPQCAHFPVSFESTRDSESPATGIAGAGARTQYISAICAVEKCSGGHGHLKPVCRTIGLVRKFENRAL